MAEAAREFAPGSALTHVEQMHLNDGVICQLTEFGAQVYNEYYSNKTGGLDLSAGCCVRMQIWEWLMIFGPRTSWSGEECFMNNTVLWEKSLL